tara:strand:- start:306 stop:566 length:261 start_codon:yes stop_codon:yes gene_type:complete
VLEVPLDSNYNNIMINESNMDYIPGEMILDKNNIAIEVGMFVKVPGNDVEDCVVSGFDNGRVFLIELGEGFEIDGEEIEVVGELNG